ncbi:cation diffusion facilitator family transporter [Magnetococcus marinus MC-1]|uniref:Cation diffusion facilitator family transporter n=1 Tax=Magnetococcus marinus (strain ATCC BAA-1437 / JCM 17883 / MC-1) TaxID=156889 RepID=A0LCE7_MAGMM|nr:cation diffusion facilitator family transporter [Magnetococcus marinus]ABK45640.1 cation diffusion facilitator family transporter [Magnetococcus marinus MC-1]
MHMHTPPGQLDTREQQANRCLIVGVWVNLLLTIAKIIAGVVGNSAAMVADGIHSASDLISDGAVWLGMRVARQEPDEEHPYGHGRFETLATLFIALALAGVAIGIVADAVDRIQWGGNVGTPLPVPTDVALIAVVVSIFTKEALFHYTKRVGERLNQRALVANAWHHRSDAVSSVAAMVGIVGAQLGWPVMDPIAAVVVAAILFKVAYGFLLEVYREFTDASSAVDEKIQSQINQVIENHPDVRSAHLVKARRSGSDVQVDIHVVVKGTLSVSEGHQIAEQIRLHLLKEIMAVKDVLVHIDPEDDTKAEIPISYPNRGEVRRWIEPLVTAPFAGIDGLMLHYTVDGIILDLVLHPAGNISSADLQRGSETLAAAILAHPGGLVKEVRAHLALCRQPQTTIV